MMSLRLMLFTRTFRYEVQIHAGNARTKGTEGGDRNRELPMIPESVRVTETTSNTEKEHNLN